MLLFPTVNNKRLLKVQTNINHTDLVWDAVPSWSMWSSTCSRCRQNSSLGPPASEPSPPLFPAPSLNSPVCPSAVPAPQGPTPPPLRWKLLLWNHPVPLWKTLCSSVSSLKTQNSGKINKNAWQAWQVGTDNACSTVDGHYACKFCYLLCK